MDMRPISEILDELLDGLGVGMETAGTVEMPRDDAGSAKRPTPLKLVWNNTALSKTAERANASAGLLKIVVTN
ncbi:hypothetical protein [Devosia sp. 1635]|uniref:hypothetical protein n=1 Tax=Devosia sp. 1635 TaxID=2726066 RepID=UPI00156499A3|nr:hypothetical protein [Devosia sp. 1635]